MNDPAGTVCYVSEKSNDIVQKTERRGRILAISGYVLHNLFFFRQRTWWTPLLDFIAWTAIALLAGLAAISITTLMPPFRRLKRRAVHGWKWAFPPKKARTAPGPIWALSGRDRISGD